MALTLAYCAEHGCRVGHKLLGALVELVALLPAAFAPNLAQRQVVVDNELELLCFFSLVQNGLDHGATLLQVFICIRRHEHIQRLVVPLFTVVDFGLVLRSISTN